MAADRPRRAIAGRLLPWSIAALAAYLVFAGTPRGPGLTPDAMGYVRGAGYFLGGAGSGELSSGWPPGFALALAGVQSLVGDLFTAARLLQSLLAGVNLLLLCRLIERGGVDRSMAALLALMVLAQPAFLDVHLMIWSEPLFLALVLLDLCWLTDALGAGGRPWIWVRLGAVVGAAIMVRYAGLFLVLANALAILLLSRPGETWLARVRQTATASGLAVLPLLAWFGFNHWRGQSATERELAWHPAGQQQLGELAHSLAGWFRLPGSAGLVVLALLFAALAALAWRARNAADSGQRIVGVLPMAVLAYVGFIWVTISVVDYYTPFDERILAPVFPVCLAALAIGARRWLSPLGAKAGWLAIPLAVWLGLGALASGQLWQRSRADGLYLSARGFQDMPVLGLLRDMPGRPAILSNGPELIELYARRPAAILPSRFSPKSGRDNPHFAQQFAEQAGRADMIVSFRPFASRTYLPTPAEIDGLAGFERIYEDPEAIVWFRPTQARAAPPSPP